MPSLESIRNKLAREAREAEADDYVEIIGLEDIDDEDDYDSIALTDDGTTVSVARHPAAGGGDERAPAEDEYPDPDEEAPNDEDGDPAPRAGAQTGAPQEDLGSRARQKRHIQDEIALRILKSEVDKWSKQKDKREEQKRATFTSLYYRASVALRKDGQAHRLGEGCQGQEPGSALEHHQGCCTDRLVRR